MGTIEVENEFTLTKPGTPEGCYSVSHLQDPTYFHTSIPLQKLSSHFQSGLGYGKIQNLNTRSTGVAGDKFKTPKPNLNISGSLPSYESLASYRNTGTAWSFKAVPGAMGNSTAYMRYSSPEVGNFNANAEPLCGQTWCTLCNTCCVSSTSSQNRSIAHFERAYQDRAGTEFYAYIPHRLPHVIALQSFAQNGPISTSKDVINESNCISYYPVQFCQTASDERNVATEVGTQSKSGDETAVNGMLSLPGDHENISKGVVTTDAPSYSFDWQSNPNVQPLSTLSNFNTEYSSEFRSSFDQIPNKQPIWPGHTWLGQDACFTSFISSSLPPSEVSNWTPVQYPSSEVAPHSSLHIERPSESIMLVNEFNNAPHEQAPQPTQDCHASGIANSTTPNTERVEEERTSPCVSSLSRDNYLLRARQSGMSYKEIKLKGGFSEAEATLRGRHRVLTKRKEARVRKPVFTNKDLQLLVTAVTLLRQAHPKRVPNNTANKRASYGYVRNKIPWKQVAEYILQNGGSYHFGPNTCCKKWNEMQSKKEGVD